MRLTRLINLAFVEKGGDIVKDLLLSQTSKSYKRLNSCGDILIDMLHNGKLDNFDKASIAYLNIQYDYGRCIKL